MSIKLKVYHSKLAERKLLKLQAYILQEWGKASRDNFIEIYLQAMEQISTMPKSCPESRFKKGIRNCVISKQTSILYRIKNNEIEIITLFDNRQNQESLFEELKRHFA